jgi:hypothetical protein
MRNANLKLTFVAACTLAGCSQIIGLSEYDIDPTLGVSEGGEGGAPPSTAGTHSTEAGQGGEPGQAGEPGSGGVPAGGAAAGGTPAEGGEAGAAGTPPSVVLKCDSAACCKELGGRAVGVEMLKDGGFELGPPADGATPWTEDSAQGYTIITDGVEEKAAPHLGTYFAFLAGITNETSDIQSESLKIPADAGWIELSGFRYFQLDSAKTDTLNADFMGIGFYDAGVESPVQLPFFWDNSDPGATASWTKFDAEWDAAPHAGKNRYLLLRGSTDDHVTDADLTSSNYMIDDVSLKVFRCYE